MKGGREEMGEDGMGQEGKGIEVAESREKKGRGGIVYGKDGMGIEGERQRMGRRECGRMG